MYSIRRLIIIILIVLVSISFATELPHVIVQAVPLTDRVRANKIFDVAVIFSISDGWHTYWENPGDAGLETSFKWDLPKGFKVIDMQEPVPSRLTEEGITTFVHQKEAIYLFQILPMAKPADTSSFALSVDWLECREGCLPGSAGIKFSLPTIPGQVEQRDEWSRLKTRAQQKFPKTSLMRDINIRQSNGNLEVILKHKIKQSAKILEADFFPLEEMVFDINEIVQLKRGFLKDKILIPLLSERDHDPEYLRGILVLKISGQTIPGTIYYKLNQPIQS